MVRFTEVNDITLEEAATRDEWNDDDATGQTNKAKYKQMSVL